MLFIPKDRNYTSEEAERKANGYAMEYIIKIKGSIEDVVNVFKKTVTDAVSGLTEKVKSFENIMTEYFNNTDGKYHTDMEAKADKLEVSTELNKKADKAETYTKEEVEAMAEQTQDNIESYLAMNHYTSKEIDTLLEAKSNKDLSNIDDAVFKMKAENAGVVGAVSSVNEKTGDVVLSATDVGAYTKTESRQLVSEVIDSMVMPFLNEKANKYDVYTKAEVDSITGDIDTALDSIIAIQNELLGV